MTDDSLQRVIALIIRDCCEDEPDHSWAAIHIHPLTLEGIIKRHLAALSAQTEARDGARYRYVISGGNSITDPKARRDYYRIVNTIGKPIRKEKLDEAIDKAIAQGDL